MTIIGTPRRGTWKQRLFAARNAGNQSRTVSFFDAQKRSLFRDLRGTVLEIGPGAGPNLRYYPADIHWIGVEPNPYMYPYLLQAIQASGHSPERFLIHPGDPQGGRLPVEDGSMDVVVGTLVLCSVTRPEDTLREILRVLKPGGRYLFMEHVAAQPGTRLRSVQNFLQPAWTWAVEGCHPNRETWETISQAGFQEVRLEHYSIPGLGPVSPQIAGQAIKGR